MEDKERQKRRSLQIRRYGIFNKQGHLFSKVHFGQLQTSRSLHTPTRILKVYVRGLNGVWSCTIQMFSTTHDSVKAASLGNRSHYGKGRQTYIQGQGGDKELPDFLSLSQGSTSIMLSG